MPEWSGGRLLDGERLSEQSRSSVGIHGGGKRAEGVSDGGSNWRRVPLRRVPACVCRLRSRSHALTLTCVHITLFAGRSTGNGGFSGNVCTAQQDALGVGVGGSEVLTLYSRVTVQVGEMKL